MSTQTQHTSILLVEDEPQQREVLAAVLEAEGYAVLKAESAEAALSHLRDSRPGIIVTDVKLPGTDGFTFFDTVRQSTTSSSTTPFIFITGYNEPQAIERVKQLGAAGYVTKPYDLSDLLELIRKTLDAASQKR